MINAAKHKLAQLEQDNRVQPSLPLQQPIQPEDTAVSKQLQQLQQQLATLDLEDMTPKQAFDLMYEWKKALD